jgi:hypothetical protein
MKFRSILLFRSIRLWMMVFVLRVELCLLRHALHLGLFGKGTSDCNISRVKSEGFLGSATA